MVDALFLNGSWVVLQIFIFVIFGFRAYTGGGFNIIICCKRSRVEMECRPISQEILVGFVALKQRSKIFFFSGKQKSRVLDVNLVIKLVTVFLQIQSNWFTN